MTTLTCDESTVTLTGEPDCESPHRESRCTVHVAARRLSCVPPLNVCQGAARAIKRAIDDCNGMTCGACHRPVADCWKLIPV